MLAPFLLFGFGLLFANLYVQSEKMRELARVEVEKALEMPVQITQTSVTPWSGFAIKGVVVKDPDQSAPFLAVKRFRVQFSIAELMRGRFQPRIIHIEQPAVLWTQSENGRWEVPRLPTPEPMAILLAEATPSPEASPAAETPAPSPSPIAPPVTELDPAPAAAPSPTIPTFKVRVADGMGRLIRKDGRALLSIDGLSVFSRAANDSLAFGSFEVAEARLADTLRFRNVSGDFMHYPPAVGVESLKGDVAGGTFQAQGHLKTRNPLNAKVNGSFKEVDLGILLEDAGLGDTKGGGAIHGEFAVEGPLALPDQLTGNSRIEMKQGYIRDHPFLAPLGRTLSIKEFANLPIDLVLIECELKDGQVSFEQCKIDSNRLALTADGIITTDGLIDMEAKLVLEKGLAQRLPGFVRRSLQQDAESGDAYLPFQITGDVERPETDLLDNMLKGAIGSAANSWLDKLEKPNASPTP